MLIDTHAHVNFRSFKDDARETLQRALDSGVQVINVGSQIDTSRQAVQLAEKFENRKPKSETNLKSEISNLKSGIYAVVGLHPEHTHSQYVDEEETHFLTREEEFDYNLYRELAKNPKVVGIGECGLDYFRLTPEMKHGTWSIEQIKQKQKEAFVAQIKLAKELNKVLVVHSRSSKGTDDACEDIIDILNGELAANSYKLKAVLHSYTGSPEVLQKFLDLGAYVSFNGIITFGDRKSKNSSTSAEALAKAGDKTGNMEKLVKMAPLDRILLETDCPYLTPVPNRGKRNEPGFVKFVAEKVAEFKNLLIDEVAEMTTKNARNLFEL